jgi:chromosomal replication initiator protein
MSDLPELWAICVTSLRGQVPEPTYNAWLASLALVEVSGSRGVVAAPSSMVREQAATRFQAMIEQALADATGLPSFEVELIVQAAGSDGVIDLEDAAREQETVSASLRVSSVDARSIRHRPSPGATGAAGSSRNDRRPQTLLNPRYTFENFVIGASNRFAHAAAQRVAEEPAKAYNPLFIYGPSGLGKTHILHAIGHYVYQNFSNLNVCYVSTETFLNEFIDSIRTRGQTAFKRRYRAYDVLLVDDIQLLEGKKETQEEFFYTFNSFYEAEKQIVISSDRHPRSIATLENRLRSRFESGLITDIQPPELETRLAILRKKSEGEKVTVARRRLGAHCHLRQGQYPRARGGAHKALCLRQHPPGPCYHPARLSRPLGRDRGKRPAPGDGQADPRGDGLGVRPHRRGDMRAEPPTASCRRPPDRDVPVP